MASPPPPLKRDASIPSFAPGPARSHATGKASPGSGVSIPRSLTHNRTHASNTPNTRISNNLEGPSSLMDEESQLLSESEVPKTDSESEEDSKIDPAEPAKPLIKLFQPYDFSKIPRRRVSLTVLGKPPTSTPSSMKPPPNGPTPPMMITTPQPQDRRRIQTCNAPWKSYFSTLDTMIQVPASVAPKRSRVHLPLPRPEIFMNVAQLDFSSQRRAETLRASFRIPTKLPGSAPGRVLSQVVRGGMSITRYGPPGMEEADGGGGGGNSRRGVGSVGGGGGVNICESERETNPKVVAARSGFSQVREAWV